MSPFRHQPDQARRSCHSDHLSSPFPAKSVLMAGGFQVNLHGRPSPRWFQTAVPAARCVRKMHDACPSRKRGRGECGVAAPAAPRTKVENTRTGHHRSAAAHGIPGTRPQGLTPASDGQDHTPSRPTSVTVAKCPSSGSEHNGNIRLIQAPSAPSRRGSAGSLAKSGQATRGACRLVQQFGGASPL
jgi:hypothetical protein